MCKFNGFGIAGETIEERAAATVRMLRGAIVLPRPRQAPARRQSDRVRPLWRPAYRWRDPYRPALLNGLPTRGGKPIRRHGKLLTRCECCGCPCPVPVGLGLECCTECTPRSWMAVAHGIELCDCRQVESNPEIGTSTWAKATGEPNGFFCLTQGGGEPIELFHSCTWAAGDIPCTQKVWKFDVDPGEAFDCDTDPTDQSVGTVLSFGTGPVGNTASAIMYAQNTGAVGDDAPGTFFYGETPALGCNKPHTITNTVNCGSTIPPGWNTCHSGTITFTPCCPI